MIEIILTLAVLLILGAGLWLTETEIADVEAKHHDR